MASLLKLGCAVALASWFAPAVARAYSSPDAYFDRASQGGGGGRWFTGSPADGFGCNVCHTNTPQGRDFPLYVAGLPTAGYALASKQEIVLSWPEFATRWRELRPDPTVPDAPGVARPAVGAVLELVAESGRGSGTIEIDTLTAGGAQLCESTRPNLKPRLGMKLYQVRAGLEPLLIRPDGNGLLRCESRRLGQRCLLALNNCGAHEMRFTWTAPATWEGPIWFSAGFVASEVLSGTSQEDSVQEVSIPIVQAGTPGSEYEQTLRSGCEVVRAGATGYASGLWAAGPWALLLLRRARRRVRECE
jgi:hypothetical protein